MERAPAGSAGLDATGTGGGLTTEAARRLLEQHGPNELPRSPRPSWWQRVGVQLRDPLIVVLLAAAALTTATGDWPDTSVILLVVLVNTAVGVVQESRAERAVAALAQMTTPSARVVRDDIEMAISSEDVVPGDLVVMDAGDVVCADLRLVEAPAVQVDESAAPAAVSPPLPASRCRSTGGPASS